MPKLVGVGGAESFIEMLSYEGLVNSAVYEGGLGTMTQGPHLQLVSLTAA